MTETELQLGKKDPENKEHKCFTISQEHLNSRSPSACSSKKDSAESLKNSVWLHQLKFLVD